MPIAWAGVIKRFIWFFSKLCPSGHQGLSFKWFQNEKRVFIEMDLLPTVITNSFQIQNQTFEKHFHFHRFFQWLYDHEIYSFLETSARFLMTKAPKTSLFISCKCWHQSSVYISQTAHSRTKTFMVKRQTRTTPSWSFNLMLLMTTNKFSEYG